MSHIVKIQSDVRRKEIVEKACQRLGIEPPVEGVHHLFDGKYAGLAVKLEGWHYPVVFDLESGEAKFDNYNGAWGKIDRLNEFHVAYGVETVKAEAELAGHSFSETRLGDGTIEVEIVEAW